MAPGEPQPLAETVKSFCRLCPVGCGVVVTVEDGRATAVKGDADHPVSHGYTCPKGRKLVDWHYRSDRVGVPRMRGAQASAQECLDDIAATLTRIIAESGPAAVGIFRGTAASQDTAGLYVLERFKTALSTPSYFTSVTLDCAAYPLVADLVGGHPALHLPIPSRDAPLVLLIGTNPVVSHGHSYFTPSPTQMLRRWAANGQLWVIDPRQTESAAMATRYLAPRPGTDYALLAYLVREVLREGADWGYIREWTAGVGALAEAVEPFDLARAAAITGLEQDDLTGLVTAIRSCGRVAAVTGTGVSMSESANVTVWLVWALNIITGSQDRPGGTWFNPGGVRQMEKREWSQSDALPAPGPRSRPELCSRLGQYPAASIVDEIDAGYVRALIVHGANLVTALPNPERTIASLRRLELVVVLDVIDSETVRLATHVLPCTGQLERADLQTLDYLTPHYTTQFTPAVIAPPPQCRPVWWWVAKLGERMGVPVLPELDVGTCSDEDVLALGTSGAGAGLGPRGIAGLAATAHLSNQSAWSVVLGDEQFGWVHRALKRSAGKWRLAPGELMRQLREYDPARRSLRLVVTREKGHVNSQFMTSGTARGAVNRPGVSINPDDAAAAGISEGRTVLVESDHGRLVTTARLDERLVRGVVSIPHGYAEDNVAQLCSESDIDPVSGMATLTAIPVRVLTQDGLTHRTESNDEHR
jgi:anaerobic selenocysteine-containing dehydrogenase